MFLFGAGTNALDTTRRSEFDPLRPLDGCITLPPIPANVALYNDKRGALVFFQSAALFWKFYGLVRDRFARRALLFVVHDDGLRDVLRHFVVVIEL